MISSCDCDITKGNAFNLRIPLRSVLIDHKILQTQNMFSIKIKARIF